MTRTSVRYLSFKIWSINPDEQDDVWHWTVYEDPDEHFLRNGKIIGDREKAERAARAAIAIMGGVVREIEEDDM